MIEQNVNPRHVMLTEAEVEAYLLRVNIRSIIHSFYHIWYIFDLSYRTNEL
jgi:hypothetical protein